MNIALFAKPFEFFFYITRKLLLVSGCGIKCFDPLFRYRRKRSSILVLGHGAVVLKGNGLIADLFKLVGDVGFF